MNHQLSRRDAIRAGVGAIVGGTLVENFGIVADESKQRRQEPGRRFLTNANNFRDVSRGDPRPHTLKGQALVGARLTPESWRLEIVAQDKAVIASSRTIAAGTAIDYPGLLDLGKKRGVRFLKALQCNNIPLPLGQGLWEGVFLRDLLDMCGKIDEARRVFYWGFHNNDPKQIFRSSLAVNQVFDAPPGDLPPIVAYKLNGEPIPLIRGGPVRMVVPWAHGFKSVKWLQHIVLTNRYDANDTYAEQGNDPESYLKTAAYFDDTSNMTVAVGKPVTIRGTAMVGWPGLDGVEYWIRPDDGTEGKLPSADPAWRTAVWRPAIIDSPPEDWSQELPDGVRPEDVWGFTPQGKPSEWPMRFSVARWSLKLEEMRAGNYEMRVRTVDKNGFKQPAPRVGMRSGRNQIQCKLITVE